MVVHTPTLPASLQDWHCPLQLVSQHTPSLHTPDWQSPGLLQVTPLGKPARHTPFAHLLGGAQSESS